MNTHATADDQTTTCEHLPKAANRAQMLQPAPDLLPEVREEITAFANDREDCVFATPNLQRMMLQYPNVVACLV